MCLAGFLSPTGIRLEFVVCLFSLGGSVFFFIFFCFFNVYIYIYILRDVRERGTEQEIVWNYV